MMIETVVETREGAVDLKANLSPEQVKFLIEIGLNVVLAKGATTFAGINEHAIHDIHQGNGTPQ